jgi:hypothetical protein
MLNVVFPGLPKSHNGGTDNLRRMRAHQCPAEAGVTSHHLKGPSAAPRSVSGDFENARRLKSVVWLAGLSVLAGAGLAVCFWFDPARSMFYPTCQFHRLTGLNCPGCGAQRALHELLHGHFLAAARNNALLLLLLPVLVWLATRFSIRRARGEPISITVRPAWVWLFIGAMILFGVLRNLPDFAWLSP